jgi:hypothetical protein
MHSLSRTGLALLGLTLVAPNPSRAGDPRALAYGAPGEHEHEHARRPLHLCARCQERLRQGDTSVVMPPAPVPAMPVATIEGECTACQMAQGTGPILAGDGSVTTVVSNPAFGPTMTSGHSAPGHAELGEAMSPTDGYPMTMTASSPPGHAVVGGAAPTYEPAPIGIVQTGFRPMAGMPNPPGPAGSSPFNPLAAPNGPGLGAPGSLPGHRRPHVLARALGLSGRNRWSEAMQAQKRSDHAAISYGPSGQPPSEIPASMVFGR